MWKTLWTMWKTLRMLNLLYFYMCITLNIRLHKSHTKANPDFI